MGPAVTAAPERHLIKKYANRKLYDTRTSRYITLEGISELVRDGHEIKVVDRDNGTDLTQVTLSQIVLSREKRGPREAIQEGGQTLLDYVRKTLNVPSDLRHQMEKRREDLEERADETIELALKRLRIPTHGDIDRINARLDRISGQLKKLGVVAPAMKKSRKRKVSR
jgi:polyhydroxyalkanoate synthesis repressor PhaR